MVISNGLTHKANILGCCCFIVGDTPDIPRLGSCHHFQASPDVHGNVTSAAAEMSDFHGLLSIRLKHAKNIHSVNVYMEVS